ncbi:hypothetical protein RIF29_29957 [Crotalaria pallida]|uniref:Uncharacterized protein n=1 Tax=Crotalaria pallida TaxID=3830 RepID=A0AAN9EFT4_CROPI
MKLKEEAEASLANTQKKVEEDAKADEARAKVADARLRRMRENSLKHKIREEENRFYWDQTHVGQFVNALNEFTFLNQHLNVHGAHPDHRVEDGQIVYEGGPVDLTSVDLPNPRLLGY